MESQAKESGTGTGISPKIDCKYGFGEHKDLLFPPPPTPPPSTRSGPSSVVHVVEQIDNIINKEYSDYHYWENLYL